MDPINTSPIASGSQMPPPESPKSSVGPVAGAIIIILLLVAGGLYFWGARMKDNANTEVPYIPSNDTSLNQVNTADEAVTVTSDTSAGLPAQSSSDDVSSIEADLNAMDLDQMNSQNSAGLNNI